MRTQVSGRTNKNWMCSSELVKAHSLRCCTKGCAPFRRKLDTHILYIVPMICTAFRKPSRHTHRKSLVAQKRHSSLFYPQFMAARSESYNIGCPNMLNESFRSSWLKSDSSQKVNITWMSLLYSQFSTATAETLHSSLSMSHIHYPAKKPVKIVKVTTSKQSVRVLLFCLLWYEYRMDGSTNFIDCLSSVYKENCLFRFG